VDVVTLSCCLCIRCDPMGVPAVAAGQAMVAALLPIVAPGSIR
jgi:hypothetical protein